MKGFVSFAFLLCVSLGISQALSAPPVPLGKIEVIVGAGSVQVVRDKKTYTAKKDTSLYANDEVKTTDKVAVRLRYTDGSAQVLASKTHLRLRLNAQGVPAPDFIEGAVDNVIPPAAQPASKPRFLIRAKSAVLGVRGTDFVVHTGPKGLEVHTLSGIVEAAKNERDLFTAKAIQIKQAFEVKMDGDKLTAPSAFVPEEFLGKVVEKYPELGEILKAP